MNNMVEKYGFDNFYKKQMEEMKISENELIPARVTEVQREQYKIVSGYGEKRARLKGSVFYDNKSAIYPTVGDFVIVKPNPLGDDTIYHVFERKSKFSRMDSFNEKEQLVAANFDYVFIMTSLNHDFNMKRIERYLTITYQSGALPVIILTKSDLCDDVEYYRSQIEGSAIGVPVITISSLTGEGIDELKGYMKPGRTIVFLGSSGVGKSSLVNALMGEIKMTVNGIREDDSKGRHTTTHRQLIKLDNDSIIIDTPGMRELGMWDVSDGLDSTFHDIEELSRKCRFGDCSHNSEPGCAVREALESGELSEDRWNNYLKLQREARYARAKEDLNLRMKEKSRQKSLNKFQKDFNKGRR